MFHFQNKLDKDSLSSERVHLAYKCSSHMNSQISNNIFVCSETNVVTGATEVAFVCIESIMSLKF